VGSFLNSKADLLIAASLKMGCGGFRFQWRMENGEWRMENGEWRMENGEWRMENGEWRMENYPFSTLAREWQ
jgi:hypothetical protein